MTMTPEEKAKAVSDELAGRCMAHGWVEELHHPLFLHSQALIASAIREAEDAAFDRAAAHLTEAGRPKAFGSISVGDEMVMQAEAWSADRIRSLKSKD